MSFKKLKKYLFVIKNEIMEAVFNAPPEEVKQDKLQINDSLAVLDAGCKALKQSADIIDGLIPEIRECLAKESEEQSRRNRK